MSLADDLYSIGVKLDQLKALKPEGHFSVQNRENNLGVYFELHIDSFRVTVTLASAGIDLLEDIRLGYIAEDGE